MTDNQPNVKRWLALKVKCLDWLDSHGRLGWWIGFWGLLNIITTIVF